jgi:[NiFe] hydrogenase large subunit/hydrogenase large subunit
MTDSIFLPFVSRPAETPRRIVIDPITRIEGHLRIETQIDNGIVADAWCASTMFRGVEIILKDRDPREAWFFTQRICGVCTTVHAIASVRAVENALGITIPDNARLVRNLIEAAQFVQDHVMHFYHLHALDWVDVVSALQADPATASDLQRSISSWPNSSPAYFAAVRSRLQGMVDSGQLGLFANGYWGHPAYILPAEVNLIAAAHYLEALDWQREFIKIQAILGGKNPHPQTYLVGGTALAIDPNSQSAINAEKIATLRNLVIQGQSFVSQVYLPDVQLIASYYMDWAQLGGGVGDYLSYGDFPEPVNGGQETYWMSSGVVRDRNIAARPTAVDYRLITEYVTHSWYSYTAGDQLGMHPSQGETTPNYTGPGTPFEFLNVEGKYSWLKTPRYNDLPFEVGPLARMVVAYAAGDSRARQLIDQLLSSLGLGPQALFSTLGRVAARAIETQLIIDKMGGWLNELQANMEANRLQIHNSYRWDPTTWPSEAVGFGTTEAPRGALGHWVRIQNGKIANYQAVVPTTWNGSPRDPRGQRGPFEEALIGTPVFDPARPLEVLRTIHSFDPCMACSVH